MEHILELAAKNQQKAKEIIRDADIFRIWQSIGAEVHLVGSLSMGLLVKHRDIDFHIYSSPLCVTDSFRAVSRLAEHKSIKKVEYVNLLHTQEACLEWHAWYEDCEHELWQLDMIHILKGSYYDGYFERMAERISAVLTDETKQAIMQLKYDTPETDKIMGIEYYQAVIRDGVRSYPELKEWQQRHPVTGVIEWMP